MFLPLEGGHQPRHTLDGARELLERSVQHDRRQQPLAQAASEIRSEIHTRALSVLFQLDAQSPIEPLAGRGRHAREHEQHLCHARVRGGDRGEVRQQLLG